ncbi:MAG: hypothetical protein RIQ46_1384 [Pseudomonadota bacterium]|jgi:predicted flap endonuclease-1-like 5' DNA nuclease
MAAMTQENWLVLAAVVAVILIVGLWLLRRGSTAARPRAHRPDVLDEGVAPAARNQALIDAPPAATITAPPAAAGLAGLGEAVAVGAQDVAEEAAAAAPPLAAPAPAAATADDLLRIKGIGPKLKAQLHQLGITTFAQIAAMDDAALNDLDGKLGNFAGRPRRDNWVLQARFLAAGDVAGFEAQFGKL